MHFIRKYCDYPERKQNHSKPKWCADGFNMIELQVSLVILAAGLLSFAGLFRIYTTQTTYIEQTAMPASTYYVVGQSNRWMRQLGSPAEMEESAGQSPWTPPVSCCTEYKILLNSLTKDFEQSQATADVTMEAVE